MIQLTVRSLVHYWRWQIGLALGVMVAAGLIAGSLVTGDFVRATLAQQAEVRPGKVDSAVAAADGFFTEELAAKVPGAAPVLLVQGTVSVTGEGKRANGVNVYGVTDDFRGLGHAVFPVELEVGAIGDLISFEGSPFEGKENGVIVNGARSKSPWLEIIRKAGSDPAV